MKFDYLASLTFKEVKMIEFESTTHEDGRIVTTIHISPWVLKAGLGALCIILLGLAWVVLGIYG